MTTTSGNDLCREVEERIAEVLEGTASARLFDHIGGCDECRDLRHDAQRAAELAADAGLDFRPAPDFVEKLVAGIEAARPAGAARSGASSDGAPTARGDAAASTLVVGDARVDTPMTTAKTTWAPSPPRISETHPVRTEALRTTIDPPRTFTSAGDASQPVLVERAPSVAPVSAGVPRTPVSERTPRDPVEQAPIPAPVASRPAAEVVSPSAPSPARGDTAPAVSAVAAASGRIDSSPRAVTASAVSAASPHDTAGGSRSAPPAAAPAPAAGASSTISVLRRPAFVAAAAGMLAAAAAAIVYLKTDVTTGGVTADPTASWSGTVASVARAAADKSGGLEACNLKNECSAVENGAEIKAGWTVRTDARTRAHLKLGDGTALALDRASEIVLPKGSGRVAQLTRGTVVADVATVAGAPVARFTFGHGEVEVLGTKLALTAMAERATVEVARGLVRLKDDAGKTVEVRAGEEATLRRGGDAVVASSSSIADVMEWSDRTPEEADAPVLRGLGELRAKKPGQTQERDRAVRLTKHSVKVRVVDVVARTEVDETFTNETDDELEGIFRFPLPPGAQIERLALEVDGKLLDGAFVDRDRGAAIWRGVIQNAAPKAPRPREEIIWVPGPWRDPALLEWQRGGRFELKIFPIPKRGSRRVVLTYTQVLDQAAGVRRYTYPLAHDASGTTNIDAFDFDLQVLGLDREFGLQTRGYELATAQSDGAAERRTLNARAFVPAGDLTVEYALPDRDRQVTTWAYQMSRGADPAIPPAGARRSATPPPAATGKVGAEAAAVAAAAIVDDTSPYVAIALRPKLPRWEQAKERLHVIVVDSSRSMIGERFGRATRLASTLVREMDRRDAYMLLACDTTCRVMDGGGAGRASGPGASAAGDVERFLGAIEPEGGSDLSAAMSAARAAAGNVGNRELRVIYLGDGTPSVGPTKPLHLETAVRGVFGSSDAAIVAVALGSDADTTSLGALARGGGGVVVPYVPGQKVSTAALEVLGAAYGLVLRDPEVELPAGLTQVTPARLDPIRAGGETLIVARMSGGSEINGTIRLRGKVDGERFEQTYPARIVASTGAGNAFVPRLYAAAKIAELERIGGDAEKPTVIELSRRFAVASRFTSLLVLESEAMFDAFGLERDSIAPTFTGEEVAQSSSTDAEGSEAEAQEKEEAGSGFGSGAGRLGASGGGSGDKKKRAMDLTNPFDDDSPRGGLSQSSPSATMAPPAKASPAPAPPAQIAGESSPEPRTVARKPPADGRWEADRDRERRRVQDESRMVPMRRVFDRKAAFEATNTLARESSSKLLAAESAIATRPDSRDKTVELYALYATTGRLGEAQELTAKWSGRDALDPEAITARADLAARQGERERAVRILGGITDVRPNDKAPQVRLADLHDAAGNAALACQHRVALADIDSSDARRVADAVRCAREQGMVDLASVLKADAAPKARDAIDRLLVATPTVKAQDLRGDVRITADWSGGADLDVALIDAQGRRISWLGAGASKVAVTARDVQSLRTEAMALSGLPAGSYVVEISRAGGAETAGRGGADDTVRGEVTLQLVGETRKVPFTLTGPRAEVGTVRVFFTSRLVPASDPFWGFR